MATTYATSCDVASLIRSDAFTCMTTPTKVQVDDIIERAEDVIDQRTGHTYGRTKTITNEYHDLSLLYTYGWGTPIYLQHREVQVKLDCCCAPTQQLDSGSCDKLELYQQGSGGANNFSDITDGSGYQVIGERGEIYLRGQLFTILRDNRVRVTYRYGSATVPLDIADATIKRAAVDLLTGSFRMDIIPMGADGTKVVDAVGKWRDDIDKVVRNREEVFVIP